ncbi:MAG: hypothetical protein E7426_08405 [Ruminococcaceae bacterium]|nr:hypothetical protein [Oscillospiraceae bacterium]
MTLLRDGLIALLASFGAVTLLWLLAAALPGRREELPVVLLVPLRGRAEQMEYIVRSLELRRSRAGAHAPIVLVDAGLEQEARRRADLLTGEHPGVLLISAAEVSKYWE